MCALYQNERNVGNPLGRRRGFSEQVDGIRQTGLRVPPRTTVDEKGIDFSDVVVRESSPNKGRPM